MLQQLHDRNIEPSLAAFVRKLNTDEPSAYNYDVPCFVHCVSQSIKIVRIFSHEVNILQFDALNTRAYWIRTGGQYKLFVANHFTTV